MFQQLESLQNTVARLQGQVEEQQQIIDKLKQDLKSRYTDLDQRLEQLNQRPVAPAVPASVTANPPVDPPAAIPPAGSEATPTIAPPVVTPTATTTAPVPAAVPIRQDVSAEEIERQKQAYLAAYQRFRSDGAGAAITAMQGFIQKYPASVFSPNAHYWLGEFNLAAEPANYAAAEQSFRRVIRDYDGSPKVPASYYKLGTIADLRSQRDEARKWMSELVARFASSPEARLAQTYLDQNPAGVANGAAKP